MKIIEALKKIKDLQRKAEDIRGNIAKHHADVSIENPVYGTPEQQRQQIDSWLQSHKDIVREIGSLKFRIQKTNILTPVSIELGGNRLTKSISEWIARRKDLCNLELTAWKQLTDKGINPVMHVKTSTGETQELKIRRYYDPKQKDEMIESLRQEPSLIDASLEIVNAVTDLVE